MLDISLWELLFICFIALLMISPEKIPSFARQVSHLLATVRRLLYNLQREIQQELRLDEDKPLKKQLDDLDDLMKKTPDKHKSD